MVNKKRYNVLLTAGINSAVAVITADWFSVKDGVLFFWERDSNKEIRAVNAIAAGGWSNVEEVTQ